MTFQMLNGGIVKDLNYWEGKKDPGEHTNGAIKENFDNINEINGRSTGPDQYLKDFLDIRAFKSVSVIWWE